MKYLLIIVLLAAAICSYADTTSYKDIGDGVFTKAITREETIDIKDLQARITELEFYKTLTDKEVIDIVNFWQQQGPDADYQKIIDKEIEKILKEIDATK
jgi:hypothetical protein